MNHLSSQNDLFKVDLRAELARLLREVVALLSERELSAERASALRL